ncbi:MAG: hypothetical protein RLZZ210_1675 [Pseudomonadota bacterium]
MIIRSTEEDITRVKVFFICCVIFIAVIGNIMFHIKSNQIEKYINNIFLAENMSIFDSYPMNIKCTPNNRHWYYYIKKFIPKYRDSYSDSQYELCTMYTNYYSYKIYLQEHEYKHTFSLVKIEKDELMRSRVWN